MSKRQIVLVPQNGLDQVGICACQTQYRDLADRIPFERHDERVQAELMNRTAEVFDFVTEEGVPIKVVKTWGFCDIRSGKYYIFFTWFVKKDQEVVSMIIVEHDDPVLLIMSRWWFALSEQEQKCDRAFRFVRNPHDPADLKAVMLASGITQDSSGERYIQVLREAFAGYETARTSWHTRHPVVPPAS